MMIRREYRLPDGRAIAWQETGAGPPLVLLHGWSLSGSAFAELAESLDGCRLLLPDLPGHGQSSPPVDATLPSLATDVVGWLEAVSPGPVALGGWSLGGMVALELAARGATPIDRLLLIASTPRFTSAPDWPHGLPESQVRALRRNLERRFEATLSEFFALTFATDEVAEDRLRAIRSFAVRPGGLPDRRAAADFLALLAQQDQRPLLEKIVCPTLVVHGTSDRVTPVGAGRTLAASLPKGQLREVSAAGHAPFWTQPHSVAKVIREFLAWDQ